MAPNVATMISPAARPSHRYVGGSTSGSSSGGAVCVTRGEIIDRADDLQAPGETGDVEQALHARRPFDDRKPPAALARAPVLVDEQLQPGGVHELDAAKVEN